MAEKKRIFKNTSKIPQVYYNRYGDPITLKPGETFVEDLGGVIDVASLITQDQARKQTMDDVEEMKRVKRSLALTRVAKTQEALDKLREDETNQDILDVILYREKELLDESGGTEGKTQKAAR